MGAGGKVRIPHYPAHEELCAVLPVWRGERRELVTGLKSEVLSLTGTPSDPLDWTDPDAWIPERLAGDFLRLALKTWRTAKVNPRHMTGHWSLASRYELLVPGKRGLLELGKRGRALVAEPFGPALRHIDEQEGVLRLLEIVSDHGSAGSQDLLEPWTEYLGSVSNIRSDSYRRSALYQRLRHLVGRGHVARAGNEYAVTQAGLDYLNAGREQSPTASEAHQLREVLSKHTLAVKGELHATLAAMDPYQFEHLIKRLLEELGYEGVEVTRPSHDRGVDVVGSIQVGISSVKEAVQVKRQRGNVRRPVVDNLRGSLHRWEANRGTIITTSGFSAGARAAVFEVGAAPVTLIDGQRLVDLLIEHGVGVTKKAVLVLEVDHDSLSAVGDEPDE